MHRRDRSPEPLLLGQPRVTQEIQLVGALYQNRKNLRGEIEAVEEALTCCTDEEKPVFEEAVAWMRAKLAETGPVYARAMVKAVPLVREGFETSFDALTRAAE